MWMLCLTLCWLHRSFSSSLLPPLIMSTWWEIFFLWKYKETFICLRGRGGGHQLQVVTNRSVGYSKASETAGKSQAAPTRSTRLAPKNRKRLCHWKVPLGDTFTAIQTQSRVSLLYAVREAKGRDLLRAFGMLDAPCTLISLHGKVLTSMGTWGFSCRWPEFFLSRVNAEQEDWWMLLHCFIYSNYLELIMHLFLTSAICWRGQGNN